MSKVLKDIRLIKFDKFHKQEEFLRDRKDINGEPSPNLITELRQRADRGIVGEVESTYVSPITSLVRASHIVKNIILSEDGIYGDIHILDTMYGKLLKTVPLESVSFIPDVSYSKNDDGSISLEEIYTFTGTTTEI